MLPNSLIAKLKALGVSVGTDHLQTTHALEKNTRAAPIHAVLDGEYCSTPRGELFVVEQSFGPEYRHGRQPLPIDSLQGIAQALSDPRLETLSPSSLVFLDIETSGLTGGAGTLIFLVGVGRFDGESFRLTQYFLHRPSDEPALLETLLQVLAPYHVLVTFNGKTFDVPLLNNRYTLHHIPSPLKDPIHIDLLSFARRLWRERLPSRTLKSLEETILEASRTIDEVSGYEIPWLYFNYLRTGDASSLKGVFHHNALDVISMAALLSHITALLQDPFAGRLNHGLDFFALGKFYEALDHPDIAAQLFEHALAFDLDPNDLERIVRRLSTLHKRRDNITQAVRLWEKAASQGHLYAFVELAKYYEHHRHDYPTALRWTAAALDHLEKHPLPAHVRERRQNELRHRLSRLQTKVQVDSKTKKSV